MIASILDYTASLLLCTWGIAHLFPTQGVVKGFGDISVDNKRVIMMEWITEGVALTFIGMLVAITTYIDPASSLAKALYLSCVVALNVLSAVSLLTAYRNSFIAYKLCPYIFTGSSLFIVGGILLR